MNESALLAEIKAKRKLLTEFRTAERDSATYTTVIEFAVNFAARNNERFNPTEPNAANVAFYLLHRNITLLEARLSRGRRVK